MKAIGKGDDSTDDFVLVDELSALSGVKVPPAVEEIRKAEILHDTVCEINGMKEEVTHWL